jgi:hypothetical protein
MRYFVKRSIINGYNTTFMVLQESTYAPNFGISFNEHAKFTPHFYWCFSLFEPFHIHGKLSD